MIGKTVLLTLMGTGIIGTGASVSAPVGVELAAGPVRIESGNGHIFHAKIEKSTSLALTISLKDDRNLIIKF